MTKIEAGYQVEVSFTTKRVEKTTIKQALQELGCINIKYNSRKTNEATKISFNYVVDSDSDNITEERQNKINDLNAALIIYGCEPITIDE
jgi:preprotein translocase subunit SecF